MYSVIGAASITNLLCDRSCAAIGKRHVIFAISAALSSIRLFIISPIMNRLETIDNLNLANSGVDDRFFFAHKIANDLFRYMTSFSQGDLEG